MHRKMAAVLDQVFDRIRAIQDEARSPEWSGERPRWPMIVLRSPKGWTGPKEVDGKKVEDFWRSHQVPCRQRQQETKRTADARGLDARATSRKRCSTTDGRLMPELAALAPTGIASAWAPLPMPMAGC